jgi:hypothetical protein
VRQDYEAHSSVGRRTSRHFEGMVGNRLVPMNSVSFKTSCSAMLRPDDRFQ